MIPRRTGAIPIDYFPGLYAGTVFDRKENGHIVVSVPAVFNLDAPEAQAVARPCFPYGHFYVPELGDQVWVMFENGDPTAPVWIGTWYPDGQAPAEAGSSSDPPVKRVIKSSSGQVVILDDTSGSESIIVKDKTGNSIELHPDQVLIKCVQDLTIDASGKNVEIRANKVDIVKA